MGKRDIKYYDRYQPKVRFIDEYAQASNAATGSKFDSNANVESKNVTTLSTEIHKGDDIGVNRLRMISKITEMYGEELAQEYLRQLEEHEIYRHDETHPVLPYCVSVTLYPFLLEGIKNIGGPSGPPTNLDSFAGNFINLVFAIAAQFAGAVATPEFLVYLDHFIRKEYGDDYYLHADDVVDLSARRRTIKKVITDKLEQVYYSLNEPAAARGWQSTFWNLSYYDKTYFVKHENRMTEIYTRLVEGLPDINVAAVGYTDNQIVYSLSSMNLLEYKDNNDIPDDDKLKSLYSSIQNEEDNPYLILVSTK